MSRRSVALVLALMAGMTLLLMSSRCLGSEMGAEVSASPDDFSGLCGRPEPKS